MKIILLFVVLLSIVYGQTNLYTTVQSGQGTYYGAGGDSNGACSLGYGVGFPSWIAANNLTHVALNAGQYGSSLPCGTCIRIVGSGVGSGANPITGSINAIITDECPECPIPNLDFALTGDGRWNIQWYAVDCPFSGGIQYTFQGSNPWYIKIQPRGSRSPINSFQINQGGNWVTASRSTDNYFILSNGVQLATPFQIQMTNIFGQTIQDTVSSIGADNAIISGTGVQFNPSPYTPPTISSSPAPTPSSPAPAPSTGGSYSFSWNSGSNAWWFAVQINPAPSLSQVQFDCGFGKVSATSLASWDSSTFILSGQNQACNSNKYVIIYINGNSYASYRP